MEERKVVINDPQSFNLYAYVRSDPINSVDPLGLEEMECILVQGMHECSVPGEEIIVIGKPIRDSSKVLRRLMPGGLSRSSSTIGARNVGGGSTRACYAVLELCQRRFTREG